MRLEFDSSAWKDLLFWKKANKEKLAKTMRLLASVERTPFAGIGKPEPLKHELSGYWSRRIDREHRLGDKISGDAVVVISCRYHY